MKKIFLLVCGGMLCNCGTESKAIVSLPTEESAFHLPPDELVQQYPSVKRFLFENINHSSYVPSYVDLVGKWGPPDSMHRMSRTEDAVVSMCFAAATDPKFLTNFLAIGFGTFGIVHGLASPKTYTWEKGDYTVNVVKRPPYSSQRFNYWEWKYNKVDPPKVLHYIEPGCSFYYAFTISQVIHDREANVSLGPIHSFGARCKTGGAFDYLATASLRSNRTRSIDIGTLYRLTPKWHIGFGLSQVESVTLEDHYYSKADSADTLTESINFEYVSGKRGRYGVRVENFKEKDSEGEQRDHSNVGFYMAFF